MALFEKRAAQVPHTNPTSTTFSLARILGHEAYDTDPLANTADTLKAYSGWGFACARTIRSYVRRATWIIWQKAGSTRDEWKPIDESAIPPILRRPNSWQTFGDLREQTQLHLDLAGKAFWHMIAAPGSTKIAGIQTLNPDWVREPVLDSSKLRHIGWEIQVPGQAKRVLPAEDVIFFRYPDPVDPFGGLSPVRAIAMSHDLDTYARAYGASHLRNHAQPSGILTTEAELTKEQAATISEAWKDTHLGRNDIQVLGKGAQYQPLSSTIKDLEFLSLARVSRDQILSAFHMPASRIGLIEDSSRANGEESDRVYSSLCLAPRLQRYEEPITLFLLPRLGLDPSRYTFEFESVDVADKEFKRVASSEAFSRGAITMNEYRESIGFAPDANGEGDVYFVPMGSNVSEKPESAVAQHFAPMQEERSAEPEVPAVVEAKTRELNPDARELIALRFLTGHEKNERRLLGRLRAQFSREGKLLAAAARSGTLSIRLDDVQVRDVGDDIFKETEIDWLELMEDETNAALRAGYELLPADLGLGLAVSFDMVDLDAIEFAKANALDKVEKILETSRKDIRNLVAEGLEEGWGQDKLARKITEKYEQYKADKKPGEEVTLGRARMIARTETGAAMNHGKQMHAEAVQEEIDILVDKTWLGGSSDRTREWHRPNAIKDIRGNFTDTVPIDEDFIVNDERMARPHDPRGSGSNVINCRCVMTYGTKD